MQADGNCVQCIVTTCLLPQFLCAHADYSKDCDAHELGSGALDDLRIIHIEM